MNRSNTPDSRNMIIALAIAIAFWMLWQFFVAGPQLEAQRAAQKQQQAQQQQTQSNVPTPNAPAPVVVQTVPIEQARTTSGPRIKIESLREEDGKEHGVQGSIRLTGARIDDLQLHGYHESQDKNSPEIVVLAPAGSAHPYYAEFGWVKDTGSSVVVPDANSVWQAPAGARLTPTTPVTLTWDNGQGLLFKRTVALDQNYLFTVTDEVENRSGAAVKLFPYALVARHGVPHSTYYWVLHEGMVGVFNGTSKYLTYSEMFDEPYDSRGNENFFAAKTEGGWFGITDKYWMASVAPEQTTHVTGKYAVRKENGVDVYQADYIDQNGREVAPGAKAQAKSYLFAGAKVVSIVDSYEDNAPNLKGFNRAIDWGWFFFITKPIFQALEFFYQLVGNFGVAIILLTIVIKALFYPIAQQSYATMTKMKKVMPEQQEIRDRLKDDPAAMQKEIMDLYKREKVNPLAGCLPMLIQIPVFFSLYKVLFVTIEMRHAPFFWWIQDLSAADPTSITNFFGALPWPPVEVFLLGGTIGIWPIIMGVSMWAQMKMNPPPTDPVQKTMFAWMPWIFLVMLATFPAGLVIYWTWNNLLSILQQYVLMRRMNVPVEFFENFKTPQWMKTLVGRVRGRGQGTPAE
jgi:YidC/Oxa1 family membrane protein insertase